MMSANTVIYPDSGNYNQSCVSSNVFYDIEVKKESEIQLRDPEVKHLFQNKDCPVSLHREPAPSRLLCPDQSTNVPVTSTSDTSYQSETGSGEISDERRLSQSDRSHICMTCYKGFRNKPQLTQHELVHNNVRKHVCSYCDKSFKQICHLNQHIRVHTGERPYKCDIEGCDRSFAQLSNLNHHKKNHEEHVRRDISRQFRCDVCDRSYATKNSLNTHIQKLHSNLKALESGVTVHSTTTHLPKKRKKESDNHSELDGYNFKCEPDYGIDDDLPTQVKVKSRMGHKPGLTVRIGTPTSTEERDAKRQAPRTTLPLPFTIPYERYHQGQGQDSFVSTFTDPVTQSHNLGQGQGLLLQNQHSHMFSNIDNIHKSSHMLSHTPSQHMHVLNPEAGIDNNRQRDIQHVVHVQPNSSQDSIHAEQRALMQVAVSQRESSNVLSNNEHSQIDPRISHSSNHLHSISNVSLLQQGQHVLHSNSHCGSHGNQSDQISHRVIQNDTPSHIAHHYPAKPNIPDNIENINSHHLYDSTFKIRNQMNSPDRFSHSQY